MKMIASAVVLRFVIWIGTRIKYKKKEVLQLRILGPLVRVPNIACSLRIRRMHYLDT